jgi:hypothetical protein
MLDAAAQSDMASRFRSRSPAKEHQTSVPVTDEMELSGERLAGAWSALERFLSKDSEDPAGARAGVAKWRKARVFGHLLRMALADEWEQFGGEPQNEEELEALIAKVEKHGADFPKRK